MPRIKLTAKRQATFPSDVCRQLGLRTGDFLELKPVLYQNERVWVLKPLPKLERSWIGSLKKYARKVDRPWTREEHEEETGRTWSKESGK